LQFFPTVSRSLKFSIFDDYIIFLTKTNSRWENKGKIHAETCRKSRQKLGKTMHGDLKKAKQLTFTQGLKQVVRFLEEYEQMTMIGDENGMNPCWWVRTYSQSECQSKSSQKTNCSGCLSEELLKNPKLKNRLS
jgi:hypothetical protein